MPPKRGGGVRGRRKGEQSNSRTGTPAINTPPPPTIEDEKRETTYTKPEFRTVPLIVEIESLTKVQKSHLIKAHLPDVKVLNI